MHPFQRESHTCYLGFHSDITAVSKTSESLCDRGTRQQINTANTAQCVKSIPHEATGIRRKTRQQVQSGYCTARRSAWICVLVDAACCIAGKSFAVLQKEAQTDRMLQWIGGLSDKYGRKPILLLTMIGNLASAVLWLFAADFGVSRSRIPS